MKKLLIIVLTILANAQIMQVSAAAQSKEAQKNAIRKLIDESENREKGLRQALMNAVREADNNDFSLIDFAIAKGANPNDRTFKFGLISAFIFDEESFSNRNIDLEKTLRYLSHKGFNIDDDNSIKSIISEDSTLGKILKKIEEDQKKIKKDQKS